MAVRHGNFKLDTALLINYYYVLIVREQAELIPIGTEIRGL